MDFSAPGHIRTRFPHSQSVANRMKIFEYELKNSSHGFVWGVLGVGWGLVCF